MTRPPGSVRDGPEVRAEYQPIVDLHSGRVVAVEGLIRGVDASGTVSPAQLFAEAARRGPDAVLRLDEECMRCVLGSAAELRAGATLFVNVEPATLATLSHAALTDMAGLVPANVRVVVELTERDLLRQPAQLLAGLHRVREMGWHIAVDDVGAEPAALALMSFVCPEVIKLDLAIVQAVPSLEVAAIVNAVCAEARRSGAVVLAEGIETPAHLQRALSLGATLGQGWYFARPGPLPHDWDAVLTLPHVRPATLISAASAFELISRHVPPRPTTPAQLAPLTHQVERQAMLLDDMAVVLASFEHVDYLTPETLRRYEALAKVTALTAILAPGIPAEPASGVLGAALHEDDPLSREWVVTVISPHFSAAIAARQGSDEAPLAAYSGQAPRGMEYVLTYDRDQVVAAASLLMARVKSRPRHLARERVPGGQSRERDDASEVLGLSHAELPAVLTQAISTASNGIVIADARADDTPLVYVNAAFETITGFTQADALGRNCRFLQGPGTDHTMIETLSRRMRSELDVEMTLLNYRKDGTPFWNALTIRPVRDDQRNVTHFIGSVSDVSSTVDRDERAKHLAHHDEFTGLPNKESLMERLDLELRHSARTGAGVAVVFIDVDCYQATNDSLGYIVGDQALLRVAQRLRSVVRSGDMLARLDGDEFVLVLTGVAAGDEMPVLHVLEHLRTALRPPVTVAGDPLHVSAQFGFAVSPTDGSDAAALLALADDRMRGAPAPA